MKNNIILSVLSLLIMVISPLTQAKRPGPQSVTVVTEQVQTHQVSQSLSLVGKLEAEQSVTISSEVTGRVERIAFKANQNVKKDQLLVQLNSDKAAATVAEAKAYLNDEQRKLKEFERLRTRNAITQTEIDAQQASVAIARARLDGANADLSDLTITAPFSGTVGFVDFSLGKLVNAADQLVVLDDLAVMQLDLQVPERYLAQIETGMVVMATTAAWDKRNFEGQVVGIDSRIDQETLNLRVRIQFDNADRALKPGMLVAAQIDFPPVEAPIIPVQALEYSGTKRYTYVVGNDNKVKRTEVFLGARIGNQVVIEQGLQIGQKIVVQGIVNMRDGVSVKEMNADGNTQMSEQEGNN
ncbi:efflux RND transporter periplasmic adaptor subunit [Vibrio ostreicida]|uniref:Efflux RND transporter periplasmic adaptor subunit n=1 Tax=Vibrio ostreicida TaxID=526588 RepID=A0ABT8BVS0_9VIBR|nr:efflux RND transporter periplasmic adaptor subunit [Vibrio ostreicida]MDN3609289.1 efflux RND transporter periplasmic adaptor subunit [Vibrio ostreicida]MDN3611116.1 efflux RND transporter periplasmic adaptor subunit [Vibrio ostreicida]NPD08180.1 efflux RND transporter periplasmic adaptor subunit [Vibrio ostreicida]